MTLVSPTISTPQYGNRGKTADFGVVIVHVRAGSVRQVYYLFIYLNERPVYKIATQYIVYRLLLSLHPAILQH